MTELPKHWVPTASGAIFDFDAPSPDMIDLRAIAHQLAECSRWYGNVNFTYSVAQHSLLVANNIQRPEWRIYGLLHDAAEFVTGDMSTPFKNWIAFNGADVHGLERRIMIAVWQHFDLPQPTAEIANAVDIADARMVPTERRDVVCGDVDAWPPSGKPFPHPIRFRHKHAVMDEFVEKAEAYLAIAHQAGLRRAA